MTLCSFVWYDACSISRTCHMTHSHVTPWRWTWRWRRAHCRCRDTSRAAAHEVCVTWPIHRRDITHSYMRRDSFIRATWPLRLMTHSCLCRDWFIRDTWLIHMTDSTDSATFPKSTRSRNSDSSVSRGTNSNCDLGLIWICTVNFEFLDLVDFRVVAFSVESVSSATPQVVMRQDKSWPLFVTWLL